MYTPTNRFSKLLLNVKSFIHRDYKYFIGFFTILILLFYQLPYTVRTWHSSTSNQNHQVNVNANTFDFSSQNNYSQQNLIKTKDERLKLPLVAIGLAVTSRNINFTKDNVIFRLPMLKTLLPSLCRTTLQDAKDFRINIYYSIDNADKRLVGDLKSFIKERIKTLKAPCEHLDFVQLVTEYSGKPVWSQNQAMLEGYIDGAEYFYRINDDVYMKTDNWLRIFIDSFSNLPSPRFVGVISPKTIGGSQDIFTHDFVHRSHIDILGVYYPSIFKKWYADNWITNLYSSFNRTIRINTITIIHTMETGERYSVSLEERLGIKSSIQMEIAITYAKKKLKRYIDNYNKYDNHDITKETRN